MHIDRATKYLLALFVAGMWVPMLGQVEWPHLTAVAEATVAASPAGALQTTEKPGGGGEPVRAATATLPLRWKVSWASEFAMDTTFCGTAIVVTNEASSLVNVEVEWFRGNSVSADLRPLGIAGHQQRAWVTGNLYTFSDTDFRPFSPDDFADLPNYAGYARVHADDPRIQVAAFQYCRSGQGVSKNIMSITNIPAHPAGATAEYFQTGMPATWVPPMAVPETPE